MFIYDVFFGVIRVLNTNHIFGAVSDISLVLVHRLTTNAIENLLVAVIYDSHDVQKLKEGLFLKFVQIDFEKENIIKRSVARITCLPWLHLYNQNQYSD